MFISFVKRRINIIFLIQEKLSGLESDCCIDPVIVLGPFGTFRLAVAKKLGFEVLAKGAQDLLVDAVDGERPGRLRWSRLGIWCDLVHQWEFLVGLG